MNSTYVSATWGKMAAHPLSLLMILHKCHEYYVFCDELGELSADIATIKADEEPTEETFQMASKVARRAHELLSSLKGVSPTVLNHIDELAGHYSVISGGDITAALIGDLETIRRMVHDELEARFFLLIPSPQDKMVRNAEPFGPQVFQAFPSARQELTDASTAFAMELYTASVFHLMRAVEHALRTLAWDRRVRVRTRAGRIYPFELATWEDILKKLDEEVAKVAQWPRNRGNIRVQATEFYGVANEELRGFKDAWRNHVMHSRSRYIKEDVVQVTSHVRRFMLTLSSRISEQDRTPYVWTRAQLR